MRQNTQAMAATMVGAVLGGLAGFMFFSEPGRAWRRQLEPQLEDLIREFHEFRDTVVRASGTAGEGWRLLTEAMQEQPNTHAPGVGDEPYARSRQSHPF